MSYSNKKIFFLALFFFSFIFLSTFSQNTNEFYKLSSDQLRKGNYNEALEYINKALVLDSTNTNYIVQKAYVYYFKGKFDEAIKLCQLAPNATKTHMLRGDICMKNKSYGGAIFFYSKVLKQPISKDTLCIYYTNRGLAHFALESYLKAKEDFEEAAKLFPDSINNSYALATCYLELFQLDKAYSIINYNINYAPQNSKYFKLLGKVLYLKKEYPRAIEAMVKYCDLNKEDGDGFSLLSSIYLENKEFDKALLTINYANTIKSDPIINVIYNCVI
jgi:tetratricopeptide (TPR) repeat protein